MVIEMPRFGRYEAVARLGRGAMGEVFEARHVDLGTRVAVKVLHLSDASGSSGSQRALREGRAVAAIGHPNVVKVLDVGTEGTLPYLVMELLRGEDLAQRLARDSFLSLEETADLMLPLCCALAAAHEAGVVHRDVKPSNVFLARRHSSIEPTILDFGISKSTEDAGRSSSLDHAGTPKYMAPEQLRGKIATPQSDLYALAVLAYECVTGSVPFCHDDPYELVHAIMTATVVAPTELNPDLPGAFDAVVLRALERNPKLRFDDARAFGAALAPFASVRIRDRWGGELSSTGHVWGSGRPPQADQPRHELE